MADFHCEKCELHKSRGRSYVQGRGLKSSPIVVIGGYPTKADSDKATPYMGDAATQLDKALKAAGLDRKDIFVSYLIRCHPDGTKITPGHVDTCFPHLDREVSYIKPKVIVLLGDLAIRNVLGMEPGPAVRSKIWDSSECARNFTFAASNLVGMDTETGKEIRLNAPNEFKVITGPDVTETFANPAEASRLARTMEKAAKLAVGLQVEAVTLNYQYAHTEEDSFRMLSELEKRCAIEKMMAFDIETSGLIGFERLYGQGRAEALSIAFSFQHGEAYALTLRSKHRSLRVIDALRRVLESDIPKAGHNGNFDNILLRHDLGIQVVNYQFDTFVAAYALDQDSMQKGLDDLASLVRPDLGRWWERAEKFLDKKTGYLNCPDDILLEYNAKDADATLSLVEDMIPRLKAKKKVGLFAEILMPHYRELAEMQFFGVTLDVDGAISLGKTMLQKVKSSEEACLAKVGRHPYWWGDKELAERGIPREAFKPFNLLSPAQLGDLVYKELKAPVTITTGKTKAPSTAMAALMPLQKDFPFIADLLAYRKDLKFLSTFVGWEAKERPTTSATGELFAAPEFVEEGVKLDGSGMLTCVGKDHRLHAQYHIDGTVTGRISITEPALQTIPKTKELRNLLVPADGFVFVDADFKALELRILAMLSGDPEFIRVFKEGLDPHSITASKMFGLPIDLPSTATKEQRDAYFAEWNKKYSDQRKKAKSVNFGIPYGEGADGLAASLKVPKDEAQKWLDDWSTKAYPIAARWLQKTVEESAKAGGVTYSMNRFRALPGFASAKQGDRGEAERAAKNTPIQGTGGDCTSMSIIRIHDRFRAELGPQWWDQARIVLEVHDQIVVEVRRYLADEVKKWVMEEMSRRMPFLPDTLSLEVDAEIKEKWGD